MLLKRGDRVRLLREEPLQVLDALQERIGLRAGWGRLLPVQTHPHPIEPAAQALPQPIKRFHGKERVERFRRGFQGRTRQKTGQQSRQKRRRDAVPRQHSGEIQRHGASASTASAAVGTESTLATRMLPVGLVGIVAQNAAVAIQRSTQAAVGAALLLERKSSVCNAQSSRTKRTQEKGICPLMPQPHLPSRAFSNGAAAAGLGSAGWSQLKGDDGTDRTDGASATLAS